MKSKILVTTTTFPRWENDPEPRFVLDLSKELQKQFDVTVLAPAAPEAKLVEQLEGINVLRYRYAPLRSQEVLAYPGSIMARLHKHPLYWPLVPLLVAGLYRKIRAVLSKTPYACVHANWAIPQGFVQGAFFSGSTDPPYVLATRGGDIYTAKHGFRRRLVRLALKRAAAVTSVSKALRDVIIKEIGFEADLENLHVISSGVALDRFKPDLRDEQWPVQYGLNRPLILFVGRLAEKKGLTYLLQAMATKPVQNTSASLIIVGDGPLRSDLEAEVRARHISDRVRFIGSLDHRFLPIVYASADLFCAPFITGKDSDEEGLPTVLTEAGASGLPSIVSDAGGVKEILVNAQTGFIVPQKDPNALGDALYQLITDDQQRRTFGNNALHAVQAFSWENIGKRYTKIISSTIARHSKQCIIR